MGRVSGFLFGLWVLAGAVLGGLVFGTFGVLPFAVVPRARRFRYTMPVARAWARYVVWLLRVDVEVEGQWPLDDGWGALIFCNHRSWLDPLLLMALFRSNGLSKREILWLPVIGVYGWLSGAVYFDRKDKEQRARARIEVIELARAGHRLQVFPEGTRNTAPGTQERVYLNLAMDAWHAGIPVVPCAIAWSDGVLPPGRWGAWPGKVAVRVMPPLDPGAFGNSREYAQATWQLVRDAYADLTA